MSHVVVIGGGIAGLAAAFHLQQAGRAVEVTIVEGDKRLGGKILTTPFAGRLVEEGPDAFLARVPAAAELCRQVGLGDELVSPATGKAYIWTRGALHPIPEGTVLGVPAGLRAIRAAGMLSPAAKARAALEPLLPGRRRAGDVAVGALVAARFGRQVRERLVDPLVGGINAGRTEVLSAEVSAAQLASAARSSRSLMLGLRAQRRAAAATPSSPAPVFYGLSGGLGQLVAALGTRLTEAGASVRVADAATGVQRVDAGRWSVTTASGLSLDADGVVVAVPAFVATALLSEASPRAARLLAGIEHASVDLVTVAYPRGAIDVPAGSGFLVPRVDGRLLTACTVVSQKWPALDRPDDVILRLSAGRYGDERALELDDDELMARLTDDLADAVPMRGEPSSWRVSRWVRAFPQFAPGHLAVVAHVEDDLAAAAPAVALAGAAYRGVGLPACIDSGRAAAERVLRHLAP